MIQFLLGIFLFHGFSYAAPWSDQMIQDYFNTYSSNENDSPSSEDLQLRHARALSRRIKSLSKEDFNETLLNLISHYRWNPIDRANTVLLLSQIQSMIQRELDEQEKRHPVMIIFKDIAVYWTLFYGFKWTRGLFKKSAWVSAGKTNLEQFSRRLKVVSHELPKTLIGRTQVYLTGGIIGGIDAFIIEHLRRNYLNPFELLESTQLDIIESTEKELFDLALSIDNYRIDELKNARIYYRVLLQNHSKALLQISIDVETLFFTASTFINRIEDLQIEVDRLKEEVRRLRIHGIFDWALE
ncbi:MAG: hypothetical protein CL678_04675 [Bdellovibrionaceae bacterium]|nr:hypothetical protein [Pseudobdellovibrionaceae bacterium]|tara:strand:+ start:3118 stop:4011 length:894 start_codon:yes stop_codon:yes gene_type:complete